jgi:hypothetical protein
MRGLTFDFYYLHSKINFITKLISNVWFHIYYCHSLFEWSLMLCGSWNKCIIHVCVASYIFDKLRCNPANLYIYWICLVIYARSRTLIKQCNQKINFMKTRQYIYTSTIYKKIQLYWNQFQTVHFWFMIFWLYPCFARFVLLGTRRGQWWLKVTTSKHVVGPEKSW